MLTPKSGPGQVLTLLYAYDTARKVLVGTDTDRIDRFCPTCESARSTPCIG
jgi:hypothetical protein